MILIYPNPSGRHSELDVAPKVGETLPCPCMGCNQPMVCHGCGAALKVLKISTAAVTMICRCGYKLELARRPQDESLEGALGPVSL